jgi:hypothetical protein
MDFDCTKGNSAQVVEALRSPEVLVQVQNFVINVLAEEHEQFKLRKLSATLHPCFSQDEQCAECRSESTDWMHGLRTFDR